MRRLLHDDVSASDAGRARRYSYRVTSYDVIVIGGGNAGQGVAFRTARAGKKTVLVDKGDVGGLCALRGCNPKKVMVRATEVLDEVRRAGLHGIAIGPVTIDWRKVVDRLHTFTDPMPAQVEAAFAKAGVARVRGVARFVAPDRIAVDGRELAAEHVVIATGSQPRSLAFPGAELAITSDAIFDVREPPKRMVVIGSGVVACEFAFVFARLGTRVTVVARGDRALGGELDRDFLAPILAHAERLGVQWVWNTQVRAIARAGSALRVDLGDRAIDADLVLNAAGRIAAVADLDLARANVRGGDDGIEVDDYLCATGNPHVYAAGDAHGEWQLSPMASYEGRVIARNILSPRSHKADYSVVPRAVFTTPPIALVGLSEEAARARGLDVAAITNDMTWWKVHAIAGDELARAKTVVDKATGKVVGAQLCTPAAADTIHVFALAIRCGMTAAQLEDMVYAYPTPSSALASTFTQF
jgi:glutathione reductase (NADPH)